jgi:hypothetical protein
MVLAIIFKPCADTAPLPCFGEDDGGYEGQEAEHKIGMIHAEALISGRQYSDVGFCREVVVYVSDFPGSVSESLLLLFRRHQQAYLFQLPRAC